MILSDILSNHSINNFWLSSLVQICNVFLLDLLNYFLDEQFSFGEHSCYLIKVIFKVTFWVSIHVMWFSILPFNTLKFFDFRYGFSHHLNFLFGHTVSLNFGLIVDDNADNLRIVFFFFVCWEVFLRVNARFILINFWFWFGSLIPFMITRCKFGLLVLVGYRK